MKAPTLRKLFVNLAVQDLGRSMDFFRMLGFEFDPRYCDENAACMIVSETAFVMLLRESFFKTFTHKALCNTTEQSEGLFAVSCASREAVDEMVGAALAAGGRTAMEPLDRGGMYGRSFYDPDGHHWEVLWTGTTLN